MVKNMISSSLILLVIIISGCSYGTVAPEDYYYLKKQEESTVSNQLSSNNFEWYDKEKFSIVEYKNIEVPTTSGNFKFELPSTYNSNYTPTDTTLGSWASPSENGVFEIISLHYSSTNEDVNLEDALTETESSVTKAIIFLPKLSKEAVIAEYSNDDGVAGLLAFKVDNLLYVFKYVSYTPSQGDIATLVNIAETIKFK